MAAFDAGSIEATLTLDRNPFQRGLREARAEGARFERERFTAKADIDVDGAAAAVAEAKLVDRELDKIDRRHVSPNIDMSGIARGLSGALPDLQRLSGLGPQAAAGMGQLASQSGSAGGMLGRLGPAAAVAAAAIVVAIPIIVAIGAALTALVASAAAAVAGLGALAIAGGGVLAAGLALGIGAVQRFKEQSGQAGTAAHALAGAFSKFGDTYKKAVGPGSDAVFRGLASAMNALRPLVASLQGPFTALGRSVGAAFKTIGQEIAGLGPEIRKLISGAGPVLEQLAHAVAPFLGILLNIANAAMPLLQRAAESVTRVLRGWQAGTADAGRLRTVIVGLVGHLNSWLRLAGQVGRVMLGIFRGAAPAGKSLVDSLTRGAKALADWANSRRGQEQIKKFFSDVLPLARDIAVAMARLVVVTIRFGQAMAPVVRPAVKAFSDLLTIVGKVSGWFSKLPVDLRRGMLPIASLGTVISGLGGAFTSAATIASKALTAMRGATTSALGGIRTAISRGWTTIRSSTATAWTGIRNTVTRAWGQIRSAAASGSAGVRSVVGRAWGQIRSLTSSAWNTAVSIVRTAWNRMRSTVSGAIGQVLGLIRSLPGRIRSALGSLGSLLVQAGKDLMQGFINGIKSMAGAVAKAAGDVAKGAAGAVKNALSIFSPSRVFHILGHDTMRGFELGLRAGGTGAVVALTNLANRIKSAIASLPSSARSQKSVLKDFLGDVNQLKAYETRIVSIAAKLADVAKKAKEAFIDTRLARELGAVDDGPQARELRRLQGEDTARERDQRATEQQSRLDDARALQAPKRAEETEASFVERLRKGQQDEAAVLAEIERDKRQQRQEDLQKQIDDEKAAAEQRASDARQVGDKEVDEFEKKLNKQFAALVKALQRQKISYAEFADQVNTLLAPAGRDVAFESDPEDEVALDSAPNIGRTGAGLRSRVNRAAEADRRRRAAQLRRRRRRTPARASTSRGGARAAAHDRDDAPVRAARGGDDDVVRAIRPGVKHLEHIVKTGDRDLKLQTGMERALRPQAKQLEHLSTTGDRKLKLQTSIAKTNRQIVDELQELNKRVKNLEPASNARSSLSQGVKTIGSVPRR